MKKIIYLLLLSLTLYGCKSQSAPLTEKQFCLDTIVQISLYDNQSNDILNHCFDICNEFELIFSTTNQESELYKINHNQNKLEEQEISKHLYDVINEGLEAAKLSQGQFDITIGAVSSLWDFKSDNPQLPNQEILEEKLKSVSYQNIVLSKYKIKYLNEETMIDLGALAKGYIADQIKSYLLKEGVTQALINLGGNILCVGDKFKDEYTIGVTDPSAPDQSLINLKIDDLSIVTSGNYQRYFEIEGKRYHHILNPKTGYCYNNHISSVTIISESSIQGDMLSTVCYVLGKEKGIELLNSLDNVYGCFIDENNQITYSKGFKTFVK